MTRCCAIGCSNTSKTHHLFRFPSWKKDSSRRNVWVTNVGVHTSNENKEYRLCEQHFEDNQFRQRKTRPYLDKNAVPTLKLSNRNVQKETSAPFPKHIYLDHLVKMGLSPVMQMAILKFGVQCN